MVVEDEAKTAELIRRGLVEEGYAADIARTGEDALWMAGATPYDAIVLVNGSFAREHPRVLAALRELAGSIDAGAMRRMNAAVDADARSPAEVARASRRR